MKYDEIEKFAHNNNVPIMMEDGIELLKRAGIEVIYTEPDDNSASNK